VNGSVLESPLNGYQYILVHGRGESDPESIWLKGDDACPAYDDASKSYQQSKEYQTTLAQSADLYTRVSPLLASIMGPENISYSHAFDVFDLLNVASIHNASVASKINADDLTQLRYLADESEWNRNYNATLPERAVGGMTLAGGFLRQLNTVVQGQAKTKFSLMVGSFDTFLSFFGFTNLPNASADFRGIPKFAASMALELYTVGTNDAFPTHPEQDLWVRFLFRNGTGGSDSMGAYPLFGGTQSSIPYGQFVAELSTRSIQTLRDWCTTCQSEQAFCAAATQDNPDARPSAANAGSAVSNAAAGAIGAAVTLAVITLFAGLAWLVLRRRSRKPAARAENVPGEKYRMGSASDGDSASDSV
jgi:prostatic aicd phosphatase